LQWSCGDACGELRARADAELPVDLREVPLDRVQAQAELGGDLAIPSACDDELDDAPFGLREPAFVRRPSADAPELRARLLQPESRAETLEDLDSPFEGLARRALVLRFALHRSEREQRPGELERVHLLWRVRRLGRRFQRRDRALVIALRSQEEPAAATGKRAQSCVSFCGELVEPRELPLRSEKVAAGDQRLDRDRARQLGVVVVKLLEISEARRDVPPARVRVVARELEQREGAIEAVGRSAITGPLGDVQQVGDLPARLLDLPSI